MAGMEETAAWKVVSAPCLIVLLVTQIIPAEIPRTMGFRLLAKWHTLNLLAMGTAMYMEGIIT